MGAWTPKAPLEVSKSLCENGFRLQCYSNKYKIVCQVAAGWRLLSSCCFDTLQKCLQRKSRAANQGVIFTKCVSHPLQHFTVGGENGGDF